MAFKRPVKVQPDSGADDTSSLSKGFEILRAFQPGEQYLGNKEFSRRTGLSKSTVSRLTGVLVRLGYLRYSSQLGRYALGIALLSLSHPMLSGLAIRHIARPYMKELADNIGGQVSLGMRDGGNIVYIESCRSLDHTLTVPEIGAAIPIVSSAIGRAYLTTMSPARLAQMCFELRQRDDAAWQRHKGSIDQALADMRDLGFTRSMGDIRPEIRSCGVALRTRVDSEVVVINCGVPTHLLRRNQLEREIGPKLVSTARAIDAACGASWFRQQSGSAPDVDASVTSTEIA
jgi:DNA-binding IclR family transcriptional regulator